MIHISFSSDVKIELTGDRIVSQCCLKAQAYGLVLFGRSFSHRSISFFTENSAVADYYKDNILKTTGIVAHVETGASKNKKVKVKSLSERTQLLEHFGHSKNELVLRINRANISGECCFGAFIRGVFIACGSVTSPDKNYHLEFVVPYLRLCNDLITILKEMNLNPKHTKRSGYHIIYFKDSENIEDLLTNMGATDSSLKLMGIKMQKSMRNRVNRKINFEIANISKTVAAASRQVRAIEHIDKHMGLKNLSKPLYDVAVLRLENPDLSLSALGRLLNPPISRSGVNHRLDRIVKIAEETGE